MNKEKCIDERNELIKLIYCTPISSYDNRTKEELVADLVLASGYRKQSEWISVEDRLPEEDVRVLVWLNTNRSYTKIDTDRRFEGKWVRWASDVTHWMPLPTPPTEKEN